MEKFNIVIGTHGRFGEELVNYSVFRECSI